MGRGTKTVKYRRGYARRMTDYFRRASEDGYIPTFSGAAAHLGVDNLTLLRWRGESPEFDGAYRESRLLLADLLTEGGLTKRFDSSLVRLLLAGLTGEDEEGDDRSLEVTVRVLP